MTARRDTTAIEWTHFPDGYLGVERWRGKTWNPTVGCTRVSPGCDHCYAFALHDQRYAANLRVANRTGIPADLEPGAFSAPRGSERIVLVREHGTRLPWPRQYDQPFAQVQTFDERVDQPRHWQAPCSVFVDSMADLYHESVPDEFLDRVFATMAACPQHIFMVLTKRPERQRDTFLRLYGDQPPPNIWPGASMEDNDAVEARIIPLIDTPAAVRFISAEPLLGLPDLLPYITAYAGGGGDEPERLVPLAPEAQTIHWVLVGGESGRHHRPLDIEWVWALRDQCDIADVAYFGKQRADLRPGQPLPYPLEDKQWPAAVDRFGQRGRILRT